MTMIMCGDFVLGMLVWWDADWLNLRVSFLLEDWLWVTAKTRASSRMIGSLVGFV